MEKDQLTRRQAAIEELGRLWDAGIAGGWPTDGAAAFARIKSKLDAMIAARPVE